MALTSYDLIYISLQSFLNDLLNMIVVVVMMMLIMMMMNMVVVRTRQENVDQFLRG